MGDLEGYENEIFQLILSFIDKQGYRMTSQRKKILIMLIRNAEEHLSAEDIHSRLKVQGIGISTVYRNINLFVDLGILKELKIDDTNYYELKMYARKSLHIHFVCEKCERIIDIKDKDTIIRYLKLNYEIENYYSIQINDLDIMFHGLCNDCIDEINGILGNNSIDRVKPLV